MIRNLQQLLAIREARLHALRAELVKAVAERAEVDREAAALDSELTQIAEQRRMWEDQWQNWLRDDRILRHGQEYNLYHVTLTAWAEDVQEQRAEVAMRLQAANEQVSIARDALLKAQQRVEVLRREHTARVTRTRAHAVGLVEARMLEDQEASRWPLHTP